jgi:hypothetical protein
MIYHLTKDVPLPTERHRGIEILDRHGRWHAVVTERAPADAWAWRDYQQCQASQKPRVRCRG